MADIRSDVSELYVGFFARPAEPGGARFWDDFIADAVGAGRNLDAVEQEVAARFADSNEAKSLYGFLDNPENGDASQFVDAIYQNLFNRTAEATGRRFWENRFEQLRDDGWPVERAASRFVLEILNAAENEDATTVQNKVEVATAYSERFIETGATFTVADDLSAAEQLIAETGSDATSLQQARRRLDEILDANTTNSGVVTDGYLADATVWADQDGDGIQDPDEPITTTDENGNFTFTDDAGNEIQVGGSLIARGGTDITTGLPFQGTLSAPESSTIVSPLTSLITRVQQTTGASADDAAAQVKRALALDEAIDLDTFDPIAVLRDESAPQEQKQAALQAQATTAKVTNLASVVGAAAEGATGTNEAGIGTTQALSAIAEAIRATQADERLDLADRDTVAEIVQETTRAVADATGTEVDEETLETLAGGTVEVVQSANTSVAQAAQETDPAVAVERIARVQKVIQGEAADSVRQGAETGDFGEATEDFTSENFDRMVDETNVDPPVAGGDDGENGGDGSASDNGSDGSDGGDGVDTIAPDLQAFARQTPSVRETNADTLTFRATFDEAVENVGPDDFQVTGTSASITDVASVDPSTYDFTVAGGDLASLDGPVGLDVAQAQDITDLAGNAFAGSEPATDETYLVDTIAPSAESFSVSSVTDVAGVTFDVSFDEKVQRVTAEDFNLSGNAGGDIAVSGSGSGSSLKVTVDNVSGSGTLGLDLATDNDIADLAGNGLTGGEPATDEAYGDLNGPSGSVTNPRNVDVGSDPTVLEVAPSPQSFTEVTNFGADDELRVTGASAADTDVFVADGDTTIEVTNGTETSTVTLVGVSGFFTSVDQFNDGAFAGGDGDITFA